MLEKIYAYENILLVRQNIFCPTNPIYGRAFALHAHYVTAPLVDRDHSILRSSRLRHAGSQVTDV